MDSQEYQEIFKKRGRGKYNITHGIESIIKFYESVYGKLPIEKSVYKSFLKDFNEAVITNMILEGKMYSMPCKLGVLELSYRFPSTVINDDMKIVRTNAPVNWSETLKLWKTDPQLRIDRKMIYFTNADTGGKIYSLKATLYKKGASDFMNAYSFKTVRNIRRSFLATAIRDKKVTWI